MMLKDLSNMDFYSKKCYNWFKVFLFVFFTFFSSITFSSATNFVVTNANDNGAGSLREALIFANFDLTSTAIAPHIIDATNISGTIVLDSALADIRNHIRINGPSNNGLTIKRADGAVAYSVLTVKPATLGTITVSINNLVITNGLSLTGGGIYVENATLSINKCRITKNIVNNGLGGGVCTNNANVTITNTTIDYNVNDAGLGGGVYMNFGSLMMTNCTVFGNKASIGGGLDKATIGTVILNNCTFAGDTATDYAGGIYVNLGNVEVNNTIITNNVGVSGASAVFGNLFSTQGHNLVDVILGTVFTGNTSGNVIGFNSNLVVNNLLTDNGGVTPTLLLKACSPAINAGTSIGAPALDQRGKVRANYGIYDIGAVEYSGPNVEDQIICGPSNVTITASGSVNYRWYDAPVLGNILLEGTNVFSTAVNSDTTFYVVDYTPDCESPLRVPVHITLKPVATPPVISANGSTNICVGGSVTLASTTLPIYESYNWTPNGDTTITTTAIASGAYFVTVTDTNGCTANSNTLNITVNPLPIPVISPNGSNVICQGSSVILTSSVQTGNLWSTGETTQSIEVFTTDTITVTVTDVNGCVGTSAPVQVLVVPSPPPAPIVTPAGPINLCSGSSVTLTSSYGSGNSWSPNGETTSQITVSNPGVYFVTFTNSNGCSSVSLPIVVDTLPSAIVPIVIASGPTTFCAGGSLTLTVVPPSIGLQWSTGDTTAAITVAATGSYNVTFIDVNGCSATSTPVVVTVNANPTIPTISSFGNNPFCAGDSLTLFSSSNIGNVWNPGGLTGNSITVTSGGNYTVTVTNIAGCSATSAPLAVNAFPVTPIPVITNQNPTTFCIGGSTTLVSSISQNIVWSPTGDTTATITTSIGGTYFVTHTDVNGCTSQSTLVTVIVNTPAQATIAGTNQICSGNSTILTASNGASFLWSPTGETTQTITVSNPGTYIVTVISINGCSTTSQPFEVLQIPSPVPTITPAGTISICSNTFQTLTSSSNSNNVWSPNGETTNSINVNIAGDYFVTVTGTNGCVGVSNVVTLEVLQAPVVPTITPTNPATQCGGSVALTASAILTGTYQWSDNSTTIQVFNADETGIYSVSVIAPNGCSAASDPVSVVIETFPVINLGNDTTICGSSFTLNAGNAPGATYLWSNGETTSTVTLTSTTSISVTVTNTCGIVTSNTILVTINAIPVAPIITPNGLQHICAGSDLLLTSNQLVGNLWHPNSETTNSITVNAAGNYNVTFTDANGCSATSSSVTVVVDDLLNPVLLGNDVSQCGGTVLLNANNPNATYLWSNGAITQTIQAGISGSYFVNITNACGSIESDTIVVTINALPAAPIIIPNGATTFCQGNSVVLESNNLTGNVWSTGSTSPSIIASNTGSYTVTFTDANGCSNTSLPTVVTVDAILVAPVLASQTQCAGTITLSAGNFGGSTTYQWSNGAFSSSITVNQSGAYQVVVTNSCGSVQSNVAVININPIPASPTIVANGPIAFCAGGSVVLTSTPGNPILWNTGATSSSITVTQSGNYSVIFTDGNGCSSLPSNVIIAVVDNPPVATNLGIFTPQCGGTVVLNALNPGAQYLWSTGATTQSLTVSQSGAYSVAITNSCGTVQSTIANITILTIPSAPIITANGPVTFCAGGSVNLSSNSQSAYLWSNGDTTQAITVNQSGAYTNTVVAANGCSSTSNVINVTVDTPPIATNLGANQTTCSSSITLDALNPGAQYLWSNGETTQTIQVTSSGNYSVQITNSCGTISSTVITIIFNAAPNSPVIAANGPTVFCTGGAVTLTSSYSSGNLWSTNETTQSISVNTTSAITVTVTDANGCTATSNVVNVVVETLPIATNFGSDISQCGGLVPLAGGVLPTNQYQWSNGETTPSINVSQSGLYFVVVSNSCGSVASDSILITINTIPAVPTITPAGDVHICVGNSVVLTSSSTINNTWSTAEITQTITVTNAGTYFVIVQSANGCSAQSLNAVVSIDATLTAPDLGNDSSLCATSYNLDAGNAGNGAAYLWSNGATTQNISVTQSGAYSVNVTNSCGSVQSNVVNITLNPAPSTPVVSASGPLTFCQGGSVSLTSSVTNNIVWSNGLTSATIAASQSGSYTVTVDNGGGCSATSLPIVVQVIDSIINPSLGTDVTACGGPITLDAGNYPTATFVWTDNTGNNTLPATQVVSVANSGQIFVTITNLCNSASSNSVNVTINPLPTVPVISAGGPTTFCAGDSVLLSVSATGGNMIANGQFDLGNVDFTTQYTYQANLQPEATLFVTADASTNHPSFVGFGQGGSGNFLAINGSSNAGQFVWQQTVTVVPGATYDISLFLASLVANNNSGQVQLRIDGIDIGVVMNCPNNINNWVPFTNTWTAGISSSALVSLHSMNTASGGNDFAMDNISMICTSCVGGLTYTWNTSETGISIYADITGSYSVTATDVLGCSATSAPIQVTVNTVPVLNLTSPAPQCGGSVILDAGNPGATYLWSNGETTQTIIINTVGTTSVSVTVTNSCGFATSGLIDVIINTAPAQAFITPSGSTTFCQGDSITLTASNGTSYQWLPNGETTSSIMVSQSNSYHVIVTAANGCTSTSAPIVVNVLPGSGASAQINASGPTTFCLGESVVLSSNSPVGNLWSNGSNQQNLTIFSAGTYILNVTSTNGCAAGSDTVVVTTLFNPTAVITSNGSFNLCDGDSLEFTVNPNVSYLWNNGSTSQTITADTAGVYTVTVTGTNGCTATAQPVQIVTIALPPTPQIFVSGALGCTGGGSVELGSSSPINNVWNIGATSQTVTIYGAGNYWVTVNNSFGCKSTSDTILINPTFSNIQVTVTSPLFDGGYNVQCHDGTNGKAIAEPRDGQEPYSYLWSNNATTQVVDNLKGGDENVYSVTVTDAFGCTTEGSITLTNPPDALEKMPRGFSPDGNGVNDQLVIPGIQVYLTNNVVIFNRWGNEVYNSGGNYQNTWEGKGKGGDELPEGTYFVIFTADSPDCGVINENRWIELRRK